MKYLLRYEDIHAVKHTRHNERETLFWTKAASILGLPQKKLVGSEVPIEKGKALWQLVNFMARNIPCYSDKRLAPWFDVVLRWEKLCKRYAPVFLEKSPHYLANWSNLDCIKDMISLLDLDGNIPHQIVGLVRHPLNTLYSIHRRWKLNLHE